MKSLFTVAFTVFIASVPVAAQPTGSINKIFIILMENHDWSEVQGNPNAPYINNTLLPGASYATQYNTPPGNHPSLPNYLWLEAGTNFGVSDDGDPSENAVDTSSHLTDLLEAAGLSWKAYEEDISGGDCPLVSYQDYAPKHNPFVYFNDVTGNQDPQSAHCISHIRPYSELAADLASGNVANYNFITPNLCNDTHDCDVSAGDAWLSTEVPRIMGSAAYSTAVIFIVWDEGSDGGDGPVGMIVVSPYGRGNGYSNSIAYTHSSTLATIQNILGVSPLLGDAANAVDLQDLFVHY